MTLRLILFMCLSLAACQNSPPSFRGTELGDSMPTSDFILTDQYNNPFTLSEHEGKIVLLFFGFTYCPDVCPLTLSTWKKVQDAISEDADKVEFVYITVDPERDTQEKIAKHLAVFSDNFIGLTGPVEDLQEVYSSYGVYREKNQISDSAAGYLINHTSRINIIDTQGKWRLSFSHDALVEDLVHDIRLLLRKN